MAEQIGVRRDLRRGCGWRKPGGLYLVADGLSRPCGKLPIPLAVCPTCHHGIKPTRGWTWIDGDALSIANVCERTPGCGGCPLAQSVGRVGLLWIGEQFYPTPEHWMREARTQGVSRRISAVPKDFAVGETWVFIAHRRVIPQEDGALTAGVFHAFKPQAIEYVVKGDEDGKKLASLRARGITPVRIERIEEQPALDGGA